MQYEFNEDVMAKVEERRKCVEEDSSGRRGEGEPRQY